jgi:hypothetical protein
MEHFCNDHYSSAHKLCMSLVFLSKQRNSQVTCLVWLAGSSCLSACAGGMVQIRAFACEIGQKLKWGNFDNRTFKK